MSSPKLFHQGSENFEDLETEIFKCQSAGKKQKNKQTNKNKFRGIMLNATEPLNTNSKERSKPCSLVREYKDRKVGT